jgi:hypothetical protein
VRGVGYRAPIAATGAAFSFDGPVAGRES